MRKIFLLVIFVIFTTITFAQRNIDANHWSATIETGSGFFDGDMTVYYNSLIPETSFQLSYGGSVEYSFNPYVGLGAEYYHLPLSAKKGNDMFASNLNHYNLYLSINILNILNKYNNSRWAIYGTLGAGIATYASTYYINNVPQIQNPETKMAVTIPVGFIIEYNISRSIALAAKLQYRSHNKDNLEGNSEYDYKGVTNDFVSVAMLNLRWKFNTDKKQHVRNLRPHNFYPNEALTPALQAKAKSDSLQQELNKLRTEFEKVRPQLQELEKTLQEIKKQDEKRNKMAEAMETKTQGPKKTK